MSSKQTRPCFSCGKKLDSVFNDDESFQPLDGVYFHSVGNYGSTQIDGLERKKHHVEIYVCDECIVGKAYKIDVCEKDKFICKYEDYDYMLGRNNEKDSQK